MIAAAPPTTAIPISPSETKKKKTPNRQLSTYLLAKKRGRRPESRTWQQLRQHLAIAVLWFRAINGTPADIQIGSVNISVVPSCLYKQFNEVELYQEIDIKQNLNLILDQNLPDIPDF